MTAVKERFMKMVTENLTDVPDDEVQDMINILVKWERTNRRDQTTNRTFGRLKDKITYVASDFDSCIDDNPSVFGLEEYM